MDALVIILFGVLGCLIYLANGKHVPLTIQHWLRGHGPYHQISSDDKVFVCQCGKVKGIWRR